MPRVKKEDRTSIGISRGTLKRFTRFSVELMCERGTLCSQDEALNTLLDRADKRYEVLRR
jgi:hypothetical protein